MALATSSANIASELPLQAIAELLGVPQEDRSKLFEWSNMMVSYDDPDFDHFDPVRSPPSRC